MKYTSIIDANSMASESDLMIARNSWKGLAD